MARLTVFGESSTITVDALLQGRMDQDEVFQQSGHMSFGWSPFADCNDNGVNDACDIANGTSPDTNDDGILDECESACSGDLNGSGETDVEDLLAVIADWGDPYEVEDLLSVLDDWGCGT